MKKHSLKHEVVEILKKLDVPVADVAKAKTDEEMLQVVKSHIKMLYIRLEFLMLGGHSYDETQTKGATLEGIAKGRSGKGGPARTDLPSRRRAPCDATCVVPKNKVRQTQS